MFLFYSIKIVFKNLYKGKKGSSDYFIETWSLIFDNKSLVSTKISKHVRT